MAGNNAIGTGALILSANADQMIAGLAKAEAAAKASAGKIGSGADKAQQDELADLNKLTGRIDNAAQGLRLKLATMGQKSGQALVTGFRLSGATPAMLAEVTRLAHQIDAAEDAQRKKAAAKRRRERREDVADALAFGVATGTVAPVLGRLGSGLLEMVNHAKAFRFEMERAATISEEFLKGLDRGIRRSDEALGAFAKPADRLAEVNRQIKLTEKELFGHRDAAASVRKEIEKLNDGLDPDAWKLWLGGGFDAAMADAKDRLKLAETAAAKFSDRLAELRKTRGHLIDPSTDTDLIGEANRLTASLQMQADTFGKSAAQASIFALKQRGATEAMLAEAQSQADRIDRLNAIANFKAPNGAAQKGTAEAFSIVAKLVNGSTLADAQKQQLAEAKKGNGFLGAIATELKKAHAFKLI